MYPIIYPMTSLPKNISSNISSDIPIWVGLGGDSNSGDSVADVSRNICRLGDILFLKLKRCALKFGGACGKYDFAMIVKICVPMILGNLQ